MNSQGILSSRQKLRLPLLAVFTAAVVGLGFVVTNGHAATVKALYPGTSWQWQLSGTVNETVLDNVANTKKMYDIDLIDNDAALISRLKAKNITVVCYFSAGTSENWRPDYSSFPAAVKGSAVQGWAGENWLDVRNTAVLGPIMSARMDLAVTKGCDGLEPDNVDGYANKSGFPLTATDQLNYNRLLVTLAHNRGLSVGLKNDVDQIADLVGDFDWALNEECNQYSECGGYSAFIAQNKAVFGVEYKGSTSTFCPPMNAANYDWLLKDLDLTATRTACREGNGSSTPSPTPSPTPAPTPSATPTPTPSATPTPTPTPTPIVGDTVPPSAPTNFVVTNVTSSKVALKWRASTDNVGVTAYQILRNGVLVMNQNTLSWTNSNLRSNTTYTYDIRAYDAAGNLSAKTTLTVKTSR